MGFKKGFFRGLLAGIVIGAVGFLSAQAAHAKIPPTVRIGVDASYPPFEYKKPSGELTGFGVDLGNEICKRMQVKCVWVENSFDGMIPGLKARKFDLFLSSMSMTPKRKEQIDFTDKTARTPTFLIAKKGSTLLPTPESLKGKAVGVLQGSMQETYAKQVWMPAGAQVLSYQNQDLVYQDLVAGRVDATLQSGVQAKLGFLNTAQGANYQFVGKEVFDPKIFGPGQGIGVRKEDQDLRDAVNKALASIRADGTYNKIAKPYFDFDVYGE
ncbi:ABC transporter, substrate-binding protein [Burkholderia phage BCSR5]|nr:ABC transporter, substrate-binding protein [Burkholderia phage BCSR5]